MQILCSSETQSFHTSKPNSTAACEATVTPTSDTRSNAISLLTKRPDWQRGESGHIRAVRSILWELSKWVCKAASTPTSMLPVSLHSPFPAKQVSVLPAKLDPSLPACFQKGQFHPYQGSRIRCYTLALCEGILSFSREWESQSCETKDMQALKVTHWSHIHSYQCAFRKLRLNNTSIVSLTSSSKAGSIATSEIS